MATLTDDGMLWYHQRSIGEAGGRLDQVALGQGAGSEAEDADSLDDEVYTGAAQDNNVEFLTDPTNPHRLEVVITVKGGTEVPAGTEISEFAVMVSEENVLVGIDNFEGVEVEAGHTEEFTMPVEINR